MNASFPYQKIGPRSGSFLGKSSLWLGSDHLLLIRNHYFTEEYFRLYLRDIQAIVVRRHPRFVMPLSLLLAALGGMVAVISAERIHREWLATSSWIVLATVFAAWLTVSLRWSCSFHIQTAVGIHAIPSLHQIWRARPALQLLENRIAEVQGLLPEEWLPDGAQRLVEQPEPVRTSDQGLSLSRAVVVAAAALVSLFTDALFSWLASEPGRSLAIRNIGLFVTIFAVSVSIAALVVTRPYPSFSKFRTLLIVVVVTVGLANWGSIIIAPLVSAFATNSSMRDFYWLNQIAEIGLGAAGFFFLAGARGGETSAA